MLSSLDLWTHLAHWQPVMMFSAILKNWSHWVTFISVFSFPEFSMTSLHIVIPFNSHLKTDVASLLSTPVEIVASIPTFQKPWVSPWVCLSYFTPPSSDIHCQSNLSTYWPEGDMVSIHCKWNLHLVPIFSNSYLVIIRVLW